jgi:hypothetical protein
LPGRIETVRVKKETAQMRTVSLDFPKAPKRPAAGPLCAHSSPFLAITKNREIRTKAVKARRGMVTKPNQLIY